jgi:antagonist of KipI
VIDVSHVEILRPGWLTTVQDEGRWGVQGQGVPVSGPMDWHAHAFANRLVNNPAGSATLEATMGGPELTFRVDAWFAVTGAEFPARLDGLPVAMNRALAARAGTTLALGMRSRGARGYLAVAGGFLVPTVLGSRATHVVARLGGVDGRPLRAGDRIEIGPARPVAGARVPGAGVPAVALDLPDGGARVRVLPGPHLDRLAAGTVEALCGSRYVVSARSDRMGYRLEGRALARLPSAGELISGATVMGALQVPPSGQPILLMADRAVTGGYPIAAVVITADLPLAGQLAPGDTLAFELATREEAVAALRARSRGLTTDD